MEVATYRLTANQEVTICPLGDIQWAGDPDDLAYAHLLDHIARCAKSPHPLYIGMGDYIDFASPSNRERLAHARLYDTAKKVIADASRHLVDDLVHQILKPTVGHWLGLTQGHHHHPVVIGKHADGSDKIVDSDLYLAGLLKTKFLDEFACIKLQWPGGRDFGIVAFHGKGSSVFPWGPLNQLWRLVPNFSADLFLMGHQTKIAMGGTSRLSIDGKTHRVIRIVGTGGWTKGYVVGRRTYISEGGLSPVALGQPMIHIRPRIFGGRWEPNWTVEG